jgi:N-acetylglucosaminyldiphosphoundecaprenol N-acetyl-beta-D-mannosaminyltransferase
MSPAAESKYRQILGIRFFTGTAAEAVAIGLQGGLVVVPAAPALVELERDKGYREALLDADLALTDSGFMVLLWKLIKFERITRTSGLEYLKLLITQPIFRESGSTFWIMPTQRSRDKNIVWLKSRGVSVTNDDCYLAPVYNGQNVIDPQLLSLIETRRPAQIVIALGGGVQEKLGHYLKGALKSTAYNPGCRPGIHCIGAAIGFLSGDQVNIPDWADHLFLGWFFRCLSQPGKFLPRYWKARRLLPMLLKYRERLPVQS